MSDARDRTKMDATQREQERVLRDACLAARLDLERITIDEAREDDARTARPENGMTRIAACLFMFLPSIVMRLLVRSRLGIHSAGRLVRHAPLSPRRKGSVGQSRAGDSVTAWLAREKTPAVLALCYGGAGDESEYPHASPMESPIARRCMHAARFAWRRSRFAERIPVQRLLFSILAQIARASPRPIF
jgi:hypothetical protein